MPPGLHHIYRHLLADVYSPCPKPAIHQTTYFPHPLTPQAHLAPLQHPTTAAAPLAHSYSTAKTYPPLKQHGANSFCKQSEPPTNMVAS
jgi:hypothetical protein